MLNALFVDLERYQLREIYWDGVIKIAFDGQDQNDFWNNHTYQITKVRGLE